MPSNDMSGVRVQDVVITGSGGAPLAPPNDDNLYAIDQVGALPDDWGKAIWFGP